MTPTDALQYLANIASDFARGLPPSAQGPTVAACNDALTALAPLVQPAPTTPDEAAKVPPPLRAVSHDGE